MAVGVILEVWGDYALFTRPELKSERMSYDVPTPSAARAILEAIHWKPAIRWVIDRIHIINEIRFATIKRNEVSEKIPLGNIKSAMKSGKLDGLHLDATACRQQRFSTVLRDVRYVIEAHFELTDRAEADDSPEKHINIAKRRMRKGQTFNQPYLGCREFSAAFRLLEDQNEIPSSFYQGQKRDLGLMLYDLDFAHERRPMFFRACLANGIVDLGNCEVLS